MRARTTRWMDRWRNFMNQFSQEVALYAIPVPT
jgi:hypothetical protein